MDWLEVKTTVVIAGGWVVLGIETLEISLILAKHLSAKRKDMIEMENNRALVICASRRIGSSMTDRGDLESTEIVVHHRGFSQTAQVHWRSDNYRPPVRICIGASVTNIRSVENNCVMVRYRGRHSYG